MIKSKINFVYFIALACFWSGSFVGIKAVVEVWPPLFGAAVRVVIALLCLMLLIFFMGKNTRIPFKLRWKIWIIGLFSQALPFSFLFWGERLVSPGLAGILNGTVPIWTFVLALIFQLTNFSLLKLLGLIVGIFGVIIIFSPLLAFDNSTMTLIGAAAVMATAISYAISTLLNQYFLLGKARVDFFANIYHQHWASAVYLVLVSLLLEKWPGIHLLTASSLPWLASLYLGLFSTAIAYLIYYHLIREWDAVRASTVLYIVPVLALLWDYLFYGNIPHANEIGGVIAILCGVVFIQLSSYKKALTPLAQNIAGKSSPA